MTVDDHRSPQFDKLRSNVQSRESISLLSGVDVSVSQVTGRTGG